MSIAETFKHLLARRKLPPRPSGPLPKLDDPELISTSGERLVGGETLVLYYTDSKGEDSVRRITINRVDETHIHAWCHERLANRSFRIKGVRYLATLDGEIYDNLEDMLPVTALSSLGHLEPDMWTEEESNFWHVSDRHERRFYAARENVKGEILLLRAIARSDGMDDASEDKLVYEYLEKRLGDQDHKLSAKEKEIAKRWIKSLFPEPFEIDDSVPKLAGLKTGEIKLFLETAKKIVLADGQILAPEVALFERLGREILALHKKTEQKQKPAQ